MTLTLDGDLLRDQHGACYIVHAHEYWGLLPDRTTWLPSERLVQEHDFALLMREAVLGEGLVASMDILLEERDPRARNRQAVADAEAILERVRLDEYPDRPSRLKCHFLSPDQASLEERRTYFFRVPRKAVRCRLVGDGGVHYADIRALHQIEARPGDLTSVRKYWQTFTPASESDQQSLEILTERALYFPDWQTFPTLRDEVLEAWRLTHR